MLPDAATRAGVEARPGATKSDPLLVVDGVMRTFGGLAAVDVDHLEIERGKITALIGPNGAGKTTLFNVLTGFDRPRRGRWTFDGIKVSGQPAYRIARAGMVRTFQLTKALAHMTVLDNMKLAAPNQQGENVFVGLVRIWRQQEAHVERRAMGLLERFNLAHMRDEYAATLSGGQRKLLEMARALMTEPRMVMLDEPTAGVNPVLVQSILDHVRDLRGEGLTVLFVEHDMDVVMGISDWVVCMAEGKVIAEGPPQSIVTNDEVIDAYLGTHRAARHRVGGPGEAGEPEGVTS
jgi:branched-chain amino acid transport system ATP-binding protein